MAPSGNAPEPAAFAMSSAGLTAGTCQWAFSTTRKARVRRKGVFAATKLLLPIQLITMMCAEIVLNWSWAR